MSEVKVYTLKALRLADPVEDGTMPLGASLKELFRTYRDTCEFTEEEGQDDDHYSDKDDDPIITFTEKGKKSIKVSTFDYSPEVLMALKGGSVVDNIWSEPAATEEIFKALQLETAPGVKFNFPYCRVRATFNAKLQKKGLALLEITFRPLSPAPGKPSVMIEKPA